MRRTILLPLLVALAAPGPAGAQPQPPPPGTGKQGTPAPAAGKPPGGDKKKEPAKAAGAKPASEHVQAVARTKSIFLFAMESCDRPERCDPSLRDDAERRFLDACRLCAPPEACEAERDSIRQGAARRRSNPCVEQGKAR